MSRKHFIALAAAISSISNAAERKRMARLIGDVCMSLNRGFDWTRWNHACNVLDV